MSVMSWTFAASAKIYCIGAALSHITHLRFAPQGAAHLLTHRTCRRARQGHSNDVSVLFGRSGQTWAGVVGEVAYVG
jgi:hypothetical protein